jgi:hypothetical protein
MDELHGMLTTYEIIMEQEITSNKEATFKETNNKKKMNKKKSNPKCSYRDESDEDEEMEKFIRKLKKGTRK